MRLASKHLRAASVAVIRSVLTTTICAGAMVTVVFAMVPGATSSTRETIDISDGQSLSSFDQLAQSDENEVEEHQVVPGVSPKFLAKLSAITQSASSPDQKLSEIDDLVRSYGWPSTPPAIAQVVAAARIKVLAQKTKPADPVVGEIPCEHLTIQFNSKQQWYAGGDPFGIPFEQWTASAFNALKSRISSCGNPDGPGLIKYLDYSVGQPMAEREAETVHTEALVDELDAIVRDQKNPTQRLAAIEDFQRRLNWAAPPQVEQAIKRATEAAQDEERASENARFQAARQEEEAKASTDADSLQETQELTLFTRFSANYYVANFCAEHDAYFSTEDVERLKAELQTTFASMHLSQDKKDAAWRNVQATAPAQLAGITENDCAAEKRSYALIWPQVFAPSDPVENPF